MTIEVIRIGDTEHERDSLREIAKLLKRKEKEERKKAKKVKEG